MDGQEYLNQISAKSRPVKQSKFSGILSSKFFLVGVIGLTALVIIIVVGAILSGNNGGVKNNCFRLSLHLGGTTEIVKKFQPDVKSSNLRGSSASFYGILTNTSKSLNDYLVEKYNYDEKNVNKDILEEVATQRDGLDAELFEAKINGNLDRIYAHKMAYEISTIMTEEARIYNSASNDTLKELLNTSYNSLEKLYNNFNDFSETK